MPDVTTAAGPGHNRGCVFDESARRIKENARWLAGGVSSNFRLGMSPGPLVFDRAEGPYLFDVDGNRLIDYYLGMGPMILGHSPESVRRALENGIAAATILPSPAPAHRHEQLRIAFDGDAVIFGDESERVSP